LVPDKVKSSYGGFLTALALGKDSELFAAGVDIHGVHNFMERIPMEGGEQAPDFEQAQQVFRESSPVAWVDKWTSPVLIIHGDLVNRISVRIIISGVPAQQYLSTRTAMYKYNSRSLTLFSCRHEQLPM